MLKHKRPMKTGAGQQPLGYFCGTAQAGSARSKRAHALAEELLARGCMYIQKQVYDEAAKEFRKAIKMEPDYAEAYNNLGLCIVYMGQLEDAAEAFEAALNLFPGWQIAEANLGLAYQKLRRYPEAVQFFNSAVTKNRKRPDVWLALGDCQSANGALDDAQRSYAEAIVQAPNYDLAHYRLGMLLAKRNKLDEAEISLSRAMELDPENAEAIAVVGAIAARRGELNRARDLFMQIQDAEVVPPPAQKGLARLQVFRKGLRKAFDEFKATMPEPQPVALAYYNLGLALMATGDQARAKEAFQNAAEHQPNWAQPQLWFGFFAALDGDGSSARKYLDMASRLEPQNGMIREQLGYLALAMGLQKEADTQFAAAQQLGRVIPPEDLQPIDPTGSRLQTAVQ